jgi:hypothetical protein
MNDVVHNFGHVDMLLALAVRVPNNQVQVAGIIAILAVVTVHQDAHSFGIAVLTLLVKKEHEADTLDGLNLHASYSQSVHLELRP